MLGMLQFIRGAALPAILALLVIGLNELALIYVPINNTYRGLAVSFGLAMYMSLIMAMLLFGAVAAQPSEKEKSPIVFGGGLEDIFPFAKGLFKEPQSFVSGRLLSCLLFLMFGACYFLKFSETPIFIDPFSSQLTNAGPFKVLLFVADLTLRGLLVGLSEHFNVQFSHIEKNPNNIPFQVATFLYRFFWGSFVVGWAFSWAKARWGRGSGGGVEVLNRSSDLKKSVGTEARLSERSVGRNVANDSSAPTSDNTASTLNELDFQKAQDLIKRLGMGQAFKTSLEMGDKRNSDAIFEKLRNEPGVSANSLAHSAGLIASIGSVRGLDYIIDQGLLGKFESFPDGTKKQILSGVAQAAIQHDREAEMLKNFEGLDREFEAGKHKEVHAFYVNQKSRMYNGLHATTNNQEDQLKSLEFSQLASKLEPREAAYKYNSAKALQSLGRIDEMLGEIDSFMKLERGGEFGVDDDHLAYAIAMYKEHGRQEYAQAAFKELDKSDPVKARLAWSEGKYR